MGFGASTFSHYLAEYRALRYGLPLSTTLLAPRGKHGRSPDGLSVLVEDLGPEQGALLTMRRWNV